MADTDLTGATQEVQVDMASATDAVDKKKKIIKIVVIVVVLVAAFWLVKKFILKK